MIPLGPFDLDPEPFARGGMGVVWTGVHRRERARVAVKVLEPRADVDLVAMLETEVRAAASLDHRNVVAVWDRGIVDAAAADLSQGRLPEGSPWYAMEYVGGGVLSWRHAWTWGPLRDAVLQLLAALGHAHAHGVLHRDIKPANVLFDVDGRTVKLADFGMGWRFVASASGETRIGGTPQYMAPEQFAGDLALQGPWTDLYAVGCLLYSLVCGRPPYRGSFAELREAHRSGPFPPLAPRCPAPPELAAVLERLVARPCGERFGRAADAAAALRALPDPDPRAATPVGLPPERRFASASTSFPTLVAEDEDLPTAEWPHRPPPSPAAPPPDWRTVSPPVRPASSTVGLGLFGMRPVPIVGRLTERDRLWSLLLRSRAERRPHLVVVRGPPGSGRTRLAEWLCQVADESGAAVVLQTGCGTGADRDGLPGLVSRHYRLPPALGLDSAQHWLQRAMSVDGGDAEEARRLAWLTAHRNAGSRPARTSPDDRAGLLHRLVRRAAGARCGVVWFDDLDLDPDAVVLVGRLLAARDLPALVVLTVSDQPGRGRVGAAFDALVARPDVTVLDLGPLAPGDAESLARGLLPVSAEIARRVEEQSAGHPLLAVQLVTRWVERGAVVDGDGGYDLVAAERGPLAAARLWAERLEGWSGGERRREEALVVAAALGLVVDRDEWRAACLRVGAHDPEALVPRLAELGLGRVAALPPHRFSFVHPQLREVVLGAADPARLREIHGACAEALEQSGGSIERQGLHVLSSGDAGGAWPLLVEASRLRLRTGQPEAALGLLDRLQAASGPFDPTDPRQAELDADRAMVHRLDGRFVVAGELAEKAARVASVPPAVRVKVLRELSVLLQYTSSDPRIHPLLDEAFELSERFGLTDQLPPLWIQRGRALEYAGRLEEAHAAYLTARKHVLGGTPSVRRVESDDAEIGEVLVGLASVAQKLGRLEEAQGAAEDALARFRARHLTYHEIWAETLLGEIRRSRADLEGAERAYRGAIARYEEVSPTQSALPRANLSLVLGLRGAFGAAFSEGNRARTDAAASGHANLARMIDLFLAWYGAELGRWDAVDEGLAAAAAFPEMGVADPDLVLAAERLATACRAAGDADRAGRADAVAAAQSRALGRA